MRCCNEEERKTSIIFIYCAHDVSSLYPSPVCLKHPLTNGLTLILVKPQSLERFKCFQETSAHNFSTEHLSPTTSTHNVCCLCVLRDHGLHDPQTLFPKHHTSLEGVW